MGKGRLCHCHVSLELATYTEPLILLTMFNFLNYIELRYNALVECSSLGIHTTVYTVTKVIFMYYGEQYTQCLNLIETWNTNRCNC